MFRRTFIHVSLLAVVAALITIAQPLSFVQSFAQQPGECHTFAETGKTVCGKFLAYWRQHGGLMQQGFPISDEMSEISELNGKTYRVQYFERAVFELHPENKPPYDVLLAQLGTFQYKRKYLGKGGMTDLTVTELKYRLLDTFGPLRYCDPDYWPAGGPELERGNALRWYQEVTKTTEQFQDILRRNNLVATPDLSPEQILMIYRDYKKLSQVHLRPDRSMYSFSLVAGGDRDKFYEAGPGVRVEGVIDHSTGLINGTTMTPTNVACPRCLAGSTLISTPNGPVAVKDLKEGMAVWTVDRAGVRHSATIQRAAKTLSSPGQRIIHLVLSDGRSLYVSAGHPTVQGNVVGTLRPGDSVDGAQVVRVEQVLYEESYTYDILPSGETGFYWANGILIGSTLALPNSHK